MRWHDLTGMKFGRLTVIERANNNNQYRAQWLCVCECGNRRIIPSDCLLKGTSKSCGCLNNEIRKSGANRRTHGGCGTRLHRIWKNMKTRCKNLNSIDYQKWYGGRGIEVCKEWDDSFESFKEWAIQNGYDDKLSIDRINVNGNYEPDNCRWSTSKEQANNKRKRG